GVHHREELGGALLVDPGKLGGTIKSMKGLHSEDGLVLETEERHEAGFTLEEEL
ncbi:hypothetical protein Tco_0948246, partial [Tanacetum coccineum]